MNLINHRELVNTSAVFLHQTRISSQIIYSVVLVSTISILVALPFLFINISVKGAGFISSNLEKTELLAPVSGRLMLVNLNDNKIVKKGTVLVTIDPEFPNSQKEVLRTHQIQLKRLLTDAETSINGLESQTKKQRIRTGLYQSSWQQYIEMSQSAKNAKEQAYRIFQRYEKLFLKKVVTLAEYEQYRFNDQQADSEWQLITKKFRTQWQTEANQYRDELLDIENQNAQITEQEKQYTLRATITGSVQNLTGVQPGAYVFANQKLGEISPDSMLLAYCFVKPADIGYIKTGDVARLQIDAYNYNQWGWLTAKIVDISNDVVIQNQMPFFKVKCRLNKNYLELKSGYKGQIKKGMTFSARFNVAKRSLYQLLYDKVDDWLDPHGSEFTSQKG